MLVIKTTKGHGLTPRLRVGSMNSWIATHASIRGLKSVPNSEIQSRPGKQALISFYEDYLQSKQNVLVDSLRNSKAPQREETLQRFDAENHDTLWYANMRSFVSRLDQQRRDHLEHAIFPRSKIELGESIGAITEDPLNFSTKSFRLTVERVELGFLQRCSWFHKTWTRPYYDPPPNLQAHVVDLIRRMSETQAKCLANLVPTISLERGEDGVVAGNALVDKYIDKVLGALFNAFDKSWEDQERSLQPLYSLILDAE
ncbi:hypothetical protein B0T16DRAFT_383947 [Cercophora newfieldiana]|uniref:Uncharacterized protein n=1 Tax=Cercophora newfieldiana TaxID=92897 RepID=A0AA39YPP0_9PEZI|nr:hypothetical protein B0T16DRAFT_383947 [Cercophora newfieldiana]